MKDNRRTGNPKPALPGHTDLKRQASHHIVLAVPNGDR